MVEFTVDQTIKELQNKWIFLLAAIPIIRHFYIYFNLKISSYKDKPDVMSNLHSLHPREHLEIQEKQKA